MKRHRNNIGLMRLLLALTVVASHGVLIHAHDGMATDFVNRITGIGGLGIYCVDAFFILSGYLIAQRWQASASGGEYLIRRILRIWPAFALAYVVSMFVGWHCAGYRFDGEFWRILLLQQPPTAPTKIVSQSMNDTNLSMWSIDYEFRAYLMVMLMGRLGLLARRDLFLKMLVAASLLLIVVDMPQILWRVQEFNVRHGWTNSIDQVQETGLWWIRDGLIGLPMQTLRLTIAFWAGMLFRLYWAEAEPHLTGRNIALCAAAMIPCLFVGAIAELAVILLGVPILFWFAFKLDLGSLQRINDRWDISYGVYLYGWPVTMLLLAYDPYMPFWPFYGASLTLACVAGAISWFGMERFFKLRKKVAAPNPPPPGGGGAEGDGGGGLR